MKKKSVLILLIITLLTNTIITIPINSIATVETGEFSNEEAPYNIKIVKVATFKKFTETLSLQYREGYDDKTYMLDEEGRLWQNKSTGGLEHIFKSYRFSDIACGENHAIAIDTDGYLWGWGNNSFYQLGNGTTSNSDTPVEIYPTKQFISVACSAYSSFAIDKNQNLYAWGSNKFGETNTDISVAEVLRGINSNPPSNTIGVAKIPKLKLSNVTKVCANGHSILAIDTNGYVWGWGKNDHGEIGNYSKSNSIEYYPNSASGRIAYAYINTPIKISETIQFKDISVGGNEHSILLAKDGTAYTIGGGYYGQLGNGNSGDVTNYPLSIPIGLEELKIKKILAGKDYSVFMDENNNLWACGRNSKGALANGTNTDSATVVRSKIDKNTVFIDFAVTSAEYNVFTFDDKGDLWGWGFNNNYQLSTGDSNKNLPIKITGKLNQYTVTFKDGDTVLKEEQITSGGAATAPTIPEKTGYTFTRWDKDFSNVTSDLTVNAVWEPNAYTVTLNTNGGAIPEGEEVTSYTYGVGATLPSPTKVGYTFAGWYKTEDLTGEAIHTIGTEATGDKEYFAKWEEGTETAYTVEHYKENLQGTYDKVEEDTQHLTGTTGQSVTVTPNTYEGFTIKEDNILTGTILADGSLVIKVYYNINKYTVTFKNGNEVLKTQTVAHGESVTAPDAPEKVGHTFTGWDKNFTNVTSDLEVNAKWTVNTYTVTLNTNGGTIAEGEEVTSYTYGVGATLPSPAKAGYTFAGWYTNEELEGEAIAQITTTDIGDKEYFAKWEEGEGTAYKVEHYKQNIETNTYEKVATDNLTAKTGLTVTAKPKTYEGYHENTSHTERVASGEVAADGSLVLKLYYDINKYIVTFKDSDQIVKEETVAHGEDATAPELTKDKYVLRWDKEFNNVTNNLTVNAVWLKDTDGDGIPDIEDDDTQVEYKVKHYKQIGNTNEYRLEETEELTGHLGSQVTAVAKIYEGYVENVSVKERIPTGEIVEDGSLELRLFYDTIKNTVTFVSEGQILSTQTVVYGQAAMAPEAPTKEGYTFAGWDKDFSKVTSNLTVNAKWNKNQEEPKQVGYKVEHYKQNIKTNTYEKVATEELTETTGSTVTAIAKTYEGFHENTSHKDRVVSGVVAEDGSLVLKLYYDINQYKVTFKDGDKVVKEETVAHGENATPPTITKPGYILSWDKGTDKVTGDTTFTAVWTKDPNYVDPNANDGKEEKPSFLPQTGESYMVIGTMSVLMSVAVLLYLKYRKLNNM